MGKLFKKFRKRAAEVRAGSKPFTGIEAGERGSNFPGAYPSENRRPGRRGTDTPLGPGRNRM